jgi:hypothetical protein
MSSSLPSDFSEPLMRVPHRLDGAKTLTGGPKTSGVAANLAGCALGFDLIQYLSPSLETVNRKVACNFFVGQVAP